MDRRQRASSTSSGARSRWRRRPTARCTSARRRRRPTTGSTRASTSSPTSAADGTQAPLTVLDPVVRGRPAAARRGRRRPRAVRLRRRLARDAAARHEHARRHALAGRAGGARRRPGAGHRPATPSPTRRRPTARRGSSPQSAGGGHHTLWRGAGAGRDAARDRGRARAATTSTCKLAIEGANPWLAWHEWDCADDATDYGWHMAQVDAATGTIGPDVRMPVPAGSGLPLYDGLGRPAAMVGAARQRRAPGSRTRCASARPTDRRGTPHAFLWTHGDRRGHRPRARSPTSTRPCSSRPRRRARCGSAGSTRRAQQPPAGALPPHRARHDDVRADDVHRHVAVARHATPRSAARSRSRRAASASTSWSTTAPTRAGDGIVWHTRVG